MTQSAAEPPPSSQTGSTDICTGWRWLIPGFLLGAVAAVVAARLLPSATTGNSSMWNERIARDFLAAALHQPRLAVRRCEVTGSTASFLACDQPRALLLCSRDRQLVDVE